MEKIPKDLGVKVGTHNEAVWTNLKRQLEGENIVSKNSIMVNEAFIKVCKDKILLEKRK